MKQDSKFSTFMSSADVRLILWIRKLYDMVLLLSVKNTVDIPVKLSY